MDICLPYNIKSEQCPPTAWGPGRPGVNQAPEPDPLTAAGTLGGALSLSTGTVLRFRQVRFEGKGKIGCTYLWVSQMTQRWQF